MELTLTNENFDKQVLGASKPVLVDFWAPWCAPCRMLAPAVEELAEEHTEEITVGKVNIDESPELAVRYRVSSIPTLIVFENGKEARRSVGLLDDDELAEFALQK